MNEHWWHHQHEKIMNWIIVNVLWTFVNVLIVTMKLNHSATPLDLTLMTSSNPVKLFSKVKAHPRAICCSNLVNTAPIGIEVLCLLKVTWSRYHYSFKYVSSSRITCYSCLLTHSFPMNPFSTPWKHQKTVRFSDIFKG